jgi:hypothetical protein
MEPFVAVTTLQYLVQRFSQLLDEELARRPPWTGNDKANKAMLHWLNAKLDEQADLDEQAAHVAMAAANSDPAAFEAMAAALSRAHGVPLGPDAMELAAAYRGDLGPLIAKYPHLEPVLSLPNPGQGHSWSRFKIKKPMEEIFVRDSALKDAAAIRRIWKFYFGKSNRNRDYEKSAEWFAAERWEELTDGAFKADGAAGLHRAMLNAAKKL